MRVMVQVSEGVACELHGLAPQAGKAPARSEAQQLQSVLAKLGVSLTPVHPGQTNPLLIPFFSVEVKDEKTAEQVIRQIQPLKSVQAAYLEPQAGLP